MMNANQAATTGQGPRWPAIVVLIVIIAGAYWAWRGPARGLAPETGSPDLRLIAASARGFLYGVNPYDLDAIAAYWPASQGEASAAPLP